jgi:hypothetical protein
VEVCGVSLPAGGITGDVAPDTSSEFHQRDVQRFPAGPPGGERPARPGMAVLGPGEQAGDHSACRLGGGGSAAGVRQAAFVVPAEQQRAGSRQGASLIFARSMSTSPTEPVLIPTQVWPEPQQTD